MPRQPQDDVDRRHVTRALETHTGAKRRLADEYDVA